MNFQQLRIRSSGFNLTEAAALNASQSGVSKHIKDLGFEFGVELFERRGERVLGLADAGRQIIPYVDRILIDAAGAKRVADHLRDGDVLYRAPTRALSARLRPALPRNAPERPHRGLRQQGA
jgi:LysR family cys regulon transcriptional activator